MAPRPFEIPHPSELSYGYKLQGPYPYAAVSSAPRRKQGVVGVHNVGLRPRWL